jgi:IS5 family transposase
MIGTVARQGSLFYVAFGQQASLIKDDLLEPIDTLLDDRQLVGVVQRALERRHPKSGSTGRKGIAADRLLRCCALKHLKRWSFRELERELRSSLVYRRFTRFDSDPIPDYGTLSRNFAVLDEAVLHAIQARVVSVARAKQVVRGAKLRTDTTVVETNIHYPTDSALLGDGIRVLARVLFKMAGECKAGAIVVEDNRLLVKRRLLEIGRAAKSRHPSARSRLVASYRRLLAVARRVLKLAQSVSTRLANGRLPITGSRVVVLTADTRLRHFIPLVQRVIVQTVARVLRGNNHHPDKVLSLFEEHTQAISKGKAHKPTEFGRCVRIDEVENGVVSHYHVEKNDPHDDRKQWCPAIEAHKRIFGKAPRMATADRGFFTATNERIAAEAGVTRVVLASKGKLPHKRKAQQKQTWFRRGLRWRAGIEGRIGTLKHGFGMERATYKTDDGFHRYVGWCVITNNLVAIARVQSRRKASAGGQVRRAA